MADTAKDLLDYKEQVEKAIKGSAAVYFYNDSILKAMMIQRGIFGGGEEALMPRSVRMYCGRGSLFLISGKSKAYNAKVELDSGGLTPDEIKAWGSLDVWQDLRDALVAFLSKGKQLELIVDNIEEIRQDSDLWSILSSYYRNVSIYHMPVKIGLDHFTTSLDSYRIENSDEEKTATCAFHDVENARVFFDSFNVLKRYSLAIAIQ